MIVRVLHERQYDVPEASLPRLEKLDLDLDQAMRNGDEAAFDTALAGLVAEVRTAGVPLPVDELVPSERTVPAPGSTLAELRDLLANTPEDDPALRGPSDVAALPDTGAQSVGG